MELVPAGCYLPEKLTEPTVEGCFLELSPEDN